MVTGTGVGITGVAPFLPPGTCLNCFRQAGKHSGHLCSSDTPPIIPGAGDVVLSCVQAVSASTKISLASVSLRASWRHAAIVSE